MEVELRSLVRLHLSINLHSLHGLLSGRGSKINLDGRFGLEEFDGLLRIWDVNLDGEVFFEAGSASSW